MAGTIAFLRHVLPFDGPYCVALWKPEVGPSGAFAQYSAPDIEAAAALAQESDDRAALALATSGKKWSVYFAVGALLEAEVWDRKQARYRVVRDKTNIRALRAYAIDIDCGVHAETGEARAYPSVEAGVAALKEFCQRYTLPKPTLVNSGSGIHAYWTLTEEVPGAEWEAHGAQLSSMAKAFGLKHDVGCSKNSAGVLRVVGTHNNKYPARPLIEAMHLGKDTTPAAFHALLDTVVAKPATPAPSLLVGGPQMVLDTNITKYQGATLSVRKLGEACAAFRMGLDPDRRAAGAVPEPVWTPMIQLAIHCKKPRELAHAISDGDPRYSRETVDAKFDRYWDTSTNTPTMGPGSCSQFEEGWSSVGEKPCEGCPSKGKILSPAVVSHVGPDKLPPLVVEEIDAATGEITQREIVEPGGDYVRTANGIGLKFANPKTQVTETLTFCPYDMYPVRMQYDEMTSKERGAVWRVHFPLEGWKEIQIPYVSKTQLDVTLRTYSIHIHPPYIDHMHNFMSHYLNKLQKHLQREMEYSKLGWRDEGFVLGDTLFGNDGKVEKHVMAASLVQATSDSIKTKGTLAAWLKAAGMYNRGGLATFRVYVYTAFATPIFALTGAGSTTLNASGAGGLGKTTLMRVCAAIWGEPDDYMVRETTQVASEAAASAYNNLPVMIDEMTMKGNKEQADFVFRFSGGKGKLRAQRDGSLRGDTATWRTICMTNANSDLWANMGVVHRDSSPHLARLVQLEFPAVGPISKAEGDWITSTVRANYGHAGRIFAAYIAQHRDEISAKVEQYIIEAGDAVSCTSEERFWVAWAASCRLAAEIARELGLIPDYPVEADVQWIYEQFDVMREATGAHRATPAEMLADFIDAHVSNTLVLSSKTAGNIDNVVHEPHGPLAIRREMDSGMAYISRTVMQKYAAENGINLKRAIETLESDGVVTREVRKVLGADTKFAAGTTRCLEVDLNRLGGKLQLVPPTTVAAIPRPAAAAAS